MQHQALRVVWIGLVSWLVAGLFSASALAGQAAAAPPSIAEQLKAQYQLVKLGRDAYGLAVTRPGTVLMIQKDGILGVLPDSMLGCPSKFQDGNLDGPKSFCASMVKDKSSFFQNGTKVYPVKLDVNLKNEKISMGIVACDSCNGTNPPSFYKGEVVFQFAKGYLEKGNVSEIEDTIAQVFSIDNGSSGGQAGQAGGQAQNQAPAQPAAAAAPAGMTNEDVVKLVQAKMSDAIIMKKIKSSPCSFDTGADALVKLKQSGVSEAVIGAMVEKQ
jgi:hypothetical protein